MTPQTFNRIEKKYIINKFQYDALKKALDLQFKQDEGIGLHESYHIANIYYDTDDNLIIKKSVSKPFFKQKLRVRAYGTVRDDSMIFLELKRKYDGYVNKRRTMVSVNEAYDMIENHKLPEIKEYHNLQVLKEILHYIKQYQLKPSLYLFYERECYASLDNEQLRITFDTNILTRRDELDIRKEYGEHLLNDDLYIMEIKTNRNFPLWLNRLLNQNHIYATSFSKYGTEFYNHLNKSKETENELCINPYLVTTH